MLRNGDAGEIIKNGECRMQNEKRNEIVERSKEFAVRIIKLARFLEKQKDFALANQIIRSGTSIGANVHEAQSSESKKDFVHKINIALKEARETEYWIDVLTGSEIVPKARLSEMKSELEEITKMLVSIVKTTHQNLKEKS